MCKRKINSCGKTAVRFTSGEFTDSNNTPGNIRSSSQLPPLDSGKNAARANDTKTHHNNQRESLLFYGDQPVFLPGNVALLTLKRAVYRI
jgi:hypothetical protein